MVICPWVLTLGELPTKTFKGATESVMFKKQELWSHGNDSAHQRWTTGTVPSLRGECSNLWDLLSPPKGGWNHQELKTPCFWAEELVHKLEQAWPESHLYF